MESARLKKFVANQAKDASEARMRRWPRNCGHIRSDNGPEFVALAVQD